MKRPWLAPLVPLYALGAAARDLRIRRGWEPVRRLRWPVISVGNLSTGGSGKTPLTIALARLLTEKGINVDVLSRGYGRRSALPLRVEMNGAAEDYGDEPLLIARAAGVPVYVAPQRYDAGTLAETDTATKTKEQLDLVEDGVTHAHIVDDGFQHRQLHRDIDILLLNREDWRDSLLPAGNLREARQAAKRAGILAIPADDPAFEAELHAWGSSGPVWHLHRRVQVPQINGPVLAFCGIARPEQFFRSLESAGLRLAASKAFRDHHRYTASDIERLLATARKCAATAFVTTEKDAVRLGPLASSFPPELPLLTARLTIEIEDQPAAIDDLIARLQPTSAHSPL
jgi:tetraacyldisaccharide 4'-kinase